MLRRGAARIALALGVMCVSLALTGVASGHALKAARYAHRTLSVGSSGTDVKQLQRYLTDLGFKVHPDGQFGAQTASKVKAFQSSENERATGRATVPQQKLIKRLVVNGSGDGGAFMNSTKTSNPSENARLSADRRTAIPPDNAPEQVKQVIDAANQITGKPYRYGGGHGSWNDSGYDCSGSVSYALHGGGLLSQPEDSGSLESWGSAGEGQWITVYANSTHAYMVVAGLRFDTSADSSPSTADQSGPRWRPEHRSSSGFVARHPDGF